MDYNRLMNDFEVFGKVRSLVLDKEKGTAKLEFYTKVRDIACRLSSHVSFSTGG